MKKIVIVDDNKEFLKTLKKFIEMQESFECAAFQNPNEALRYVLNEKEIYAVISDYEMPQMNGFELAKKILDSISIERIIIISGHDTMYLKNISSKFNIYENKIKFLCKSDILRLMGLLS